MRARSQRGRRRRTRSAIPARGGLVFCLTLVRQAFGGDVRPWKARTCDGRGAGGESRPANRDFTEMASGEGDCRVKEAPDIGDEQLWVLEQ